MRCVVGLILAEASRTEVSSAAAACCSVDVQACGQCDDRVANFAVPRDRDTRVLHVSDVILKDRW